MAASKKKKNPCPTPPKGKPPRRATGITLDQIGEDMKKEGSAAMNQDWPKLKINEPVRDRLEELEGKGKTLVQEELSERDVTYEDGEETLECLLTPAEIEKLDKQAVHLVGLIEQKKAQIASTQSMLAGEKKSLELQLSNIARKAREGKEQRVVPTRTFMDYPRCTVYTIRKDTEETIRSRAMIGDELAMELNVGGKTFKELSTRPLEDTTTVCE